MSFFSRLFSYQAIQIRDAKARMVKGKLSPKVLREISALCADYGINTGEIWIDKIEKVSFAKSIAKQHHQKFRNILVGNL